MFLLQRSGIYYIEYVDENDGTIKRKSTRTRLKREATKYLTEFKQKSIPKIKGISIELFEAEYVAQLASTHSVKYLRSIQISFKRLKQHLGSETLINHVGERQLEIFLTEVYKRNPHAAHLYYRTLKAAFNRAIIWKYLNDNPIKRIKLQKLPTHHPLFISMQEFQSLIEVVTNPDYRDIFITAFYTGMRLSEVLNLSWDAVNLDLKVIRVMNTSQFTTKSKLERIIPINQVLYNILQTRKFHISQHLVFNNNGSLYNDTYISKRFKKAIIAAGLNSKLHFHSLRHSFASNLVQKGVSLYLVKELLGHESITTTEIYAHLQKEALVEAINKLN